MANRQRLTAAQRQHHYQQWLNSGMNKNQYARHYGINIKTFGTLCRTLAVGHSAASISPSAPAALLPVAITPAVGPDTVTLNLHRASLTGSPQALATLLRELNLC